MSPVRLAILIAAAVVSLVGAAGPALAQEGGGSPQEGMSVSPSAAPNPDRPVRTRSGKVVASRDARLPPAFGPSPSKVLVIVYSDFECPVCARITDATHQIAEEWPGEVRVEFHQHALAMHPHAEAAAIAALAAHRQGKFWEMHDLLFAHQDALDSTSLEGYTRALGLDLARFRKDSADPALRARVKAESTLADRLGADGTPAFLINGRLSVGWGSWQAFRGQVQDELTAVNALLAKGTPLAAVHAIRAKTVARDAAGFETYRKAIIAPRQVAGRRKP